MEGKGVPSGAGKPMGRTSSPIEDLRLAIDCLPLHTREAMLAGVRSNEIIVGAYSDRAGGVCPMLAAHRCGGRTSFVSFARAWDRFASAKRARTASARELRVLEVHLEASIAQDRDRANLGQAIAEHQALVRGRKADEAQRLGLEWLRKSARGRDAQRV
jgi:hypothetical protein